MRFFVATADPTALILPIDWGTFGVAFETNGTVHTVSSGLILIISSVSGLISSYVDLMENPATKVMPVDLDGAWDSLVFERRKNQCIAVLFNRVRLGVFSQSEVHDALKDLILSVQDRLVDDDGRYMDVRSEYEATVKRFSNLGEML